MSSLLPMSMGCPGGSSGKEPASQYRRHKSRGFSPWVRKIPWRRAWQPTPVFLSGKSHGERSLAGYSPWGHKESDTIEATVYIVVIRQIANHISCSYPNNLKLRLHPNSSRLVMWGQRPSPGNVSETARPSKRRTKICKACPQSRPDCGSRTNKSIWQITLMLS